MAETPPIQIFLASSAELEQERNEFQRFLSVQNDLLHSSGVYLRLVMWEHFLDSVSQTSKQDDYNQQLRQCQIIVCLFHTKAGMYTQQEFDVALGQFRETGAPLIYTYFKDCPDELQSESLKLFKERLSDLGHFHTRFGQTADLLLHFRRQLDILKSKGLVKMQQEKRDASASAIANYFNTWVAGNNNIVIQGVTDSVITVNVNGRTEKIENTLDEMKALLGKLAAKTFSTGRTVNTIDGLGEANFAFILGRAAQDKSLPDDLLQHLVTERAIWVENLKQAFSSQGVSVGSRPLDIFRRFGWLIEAYLQKTETLPGQATSLRRLSFLAETYQSSLCFLCYIQLSQVLQLPGKPLHPAVEAFIRSGNDQQRYDFSNLLLVATDLLKNSTPFMPEVQEFVLELSNVASDLYRTNLYLENVRLQLIGGVLKEDDSLQAVLDEYLTALVSWLCRLAFLGRYRMVSIKDIRVRYTMGSPVYFAHTFGELNGMYADGMTEADESSEKVVAGSHTFNQSVLLMKGMDVSTSLDRINETGYYLSLSPFVIDQSVFSEKPKQTPEIYCYNGRDGSGQYRYSHYKNELAIVEEPVSNKHLSVKVTNMGQPALDALHTQLQRLFKPLISTGK